MAALLPQFSPGKTHFTDYRYCGFSSLTLGRIRPPGEARHTPPDNKKRQAAAA